MADMITLARPYAKAIFELALEKEALKEWSNRLKLLDSIASNPTMKPLLNDPRIMREELASIFADLMQSQEEESKNLISMLAQRKRLNLLPAIFKMYETYLAEYEQRIEVKVVSAYQIDKARLERLQQTLEGYLNQQVSMHFVIDSELLGGVIIYAGHQVIDGSLRGKLNRLSERLCKGN